MKRGILDLLRGDGSITVNKRLIGVLGLVEAVLYGELVSRFCYFQDRGRLNDGWFFNTVEDLEQGTGVSKRSQITAIKKLQRLGLIDMQVKGIPATRHFRLKHDHIERVIHLLSNSQDQPATTRPAEDLLLDAMRTAGATGPVTPEIRESTRKAIAQGRAAAQARSRWGE